MKSTEDGQPPPASELADGGKGIDKPFRPGLVFKNDKLYDFDLDGVTVMRGWPEPLAWRKTRTRPWQPVRPRTGFRVLDPALYDSFEDPVTIAHRKALESFCAPIPAWPRRVISMFPERQWHMLCFLARCGPAAAELAEANPALAFCLASNWAFHMPRVSSSMRSARRQLRHKQHDIAKWLGFPGDKSTTRILRKVEPSAVSVINMFYFRQQLSDPALVKGIRHLRWIPAEVMYFVARKHLLRHVSWRFLEEVNELVVIPDTSALGAEELGPLLQDVLRLAKMLGANVDTIHFDSLAALQKAHEDLSARMDMVRLRGFEGFLFPSPPLRGKGDIEPVATPAMLFEEGSIQHNCVASYIERVAAGECYVYRVHHPERATLCVSRQQDNWRIAEIKASCNTPVRPETKQAVQEWLARATPPRQRLLWEVDALETSS